LFAVFLIFFILSILLFISSRTTSGKGVNGFFELLTVPIQRLTFDVLHNKTNLKTENKLREENAKLLGQLVKQKDLERENQALRDQFQTAKPPSKKLLPVNVIGLVSFVPGSSPVDEIIVDRGESDGVKTGDIAVFKDNLVGRVTKTSPHLSVIHPLTRKDTSLTAETVKTQALGVIKGRDGQDLILDNVVLSERLEKDDVVVSRGDTDSNGAGFPPKLVIGKIASVNKKASALFQTAEVEPLVDVSRLTIVFVVISN